MPKVKTIVLSVGGSMVVPSSGDGTAFLRELKKLLFSYCRRGYRFVIVVGGGAPCRMYQELLGAAGVRDKNALDWLGIYTTHTNAHYVALALSPHASTQIITNPKQEVDGRAKILVAGGHKPGASTDHVAVQLAARFGATCVANISNVAYVYSEDPRTNPQAARHTLLSWRQMQQIVGTKWTPGMHTPFDPVATRFAARNKLNVAIVDGNKLAELRNLLDGKPFAGTWIQPTA